MMKTMTPMARRPLAGYPAWQMAALIAALALLAEALATTRWMQQAGLGALPLSIVLGMLVAGAPWLAQLRQQRGARQVQHQAQKGLLQAGIVLFGFQLSLPDLQAVGLRALLVDALVILTILPLGIWLGLRVLRLPLRLTVLLAIGSAVCGAAAILATLPVLNRYLNEPEDEQHTGIAVAAVAVLGTLSVLVYPHLQQWLQLPDATTGLLIGSTVHEVAQALAATDGLSAATQHQALIVKLVRVLMLAPVLLGLGMWLQRRSGAVQAGTQPGLPVPGFVLWFVLVVVLNSLLPLPAGLQSALQHLSGGLLVLAMTALGLNIRWPLLLQAGVRPLILGILLWLVLVPLGGLLLAQWPLA